MPLLISRSELTLGVQGQPFNFGLVERVTRLLLSQCPRMLTLTRSQHSPALRSGMHCIAPPQLGRHLGSGHGMAPGLASSWRNRGLLQRPRPRRALSRPWLSMASSSVLWPRPASYLTGLLRPAIECTRWRPCALAQEAHSALDIVVILFMDPSHMA